MIARLASLTLPLALAACASTGAGDVPRYLEQTPYRQTYPSPLAVAQALVGNYPETTEAGPTMQVSLAPDPADPARLVLVVKIEPVLDDSIAAEEWRAVLSQADDLSWRVVQLGLRRKCSRGPGNGEWGAQVCP
ncbi:MAG: hypothetical protein KDE15_11505 [Erythrobacter sp.]|nr:hypothetical protein [Erythrobacter sp.]